MFHFSSSSTRKNNKITSSIEQDEQADHEFVFQLVGDSRVGKSSLLERYVDNTYTESVVSKRGLDFKKKTLKVDDKKVRLQIYNSVGRARFQDNNSDYVRGLNAIILVFDLTSITSFNNLKVRLTDIKTRLGNKVPIILVGTKSDLNQSRCVKEKDIEDFVNGYNAGTDGPKISSYWNASARSSWNVEELFENAVVKVLEQKNSATSESNITQTQETLTEPEKLKKDLIERLNDYIKKVDDGKRGPDGFGYGFLHHKQSRSYNRQLNYELANALRDKLHTLSNPSLNDIYSLFQTENLYEIRDSKISEDMRKAHDFIKRGIRSPDLNYIIEMGQGKDPSKIRCYFKSMRVC